ncbi:mediator of RNA polymerase II transcription subunit 13 isoform X2 [Bacillus rossius redtenbacheri]|uniref:mediator of RNA polymerase II transcription subunit 13 isoform X2 n=1 Tax=Bacillus rossius redtenbacheri TaxID=93214 RepID=UPI002FDEA8D5
MTHPNHQTNGASLEDCHTNFFALTDLCGIRWRKLVWGEGGASPEPMDDPVLSSFSRCLAVDILCVWRRVAWPSTSSSAASSSAGAAAAGLMDPFLPPAAASGQQQQPQLSLRAAKELWIFWYGEEPDLSGLVAPELISGQSEQGSWESGLSYECRSLLFKALHNLIERCLLSRGVTRIGKWFVQPYEGSEKIMGKSIHFSFSFVFFVHGESTVCASIDVRRHPLVRKLSRQHLLEAQASTSETKVLLAPFGLAGVLTGQGYKVLDLQTQRLLEDWRHFYPIPGRGDTIEGEAELPQVLEVAVGGVKMRYPTCYVLVTDMDAPERQGGQPASTPPSPRRSLGPPALPAHLSEFVWQDNCLSPGQHDAGEGDGSANQQPLPGHWEFVDPARKTACNCSKYRKAGGAKELATSKVAGCGSGGSSSASAKAPKGDRVEKGSRGGFFHRRSLPREDDGWAAGPMSRLAGLSTPSGGSSYPRGQSMTPNPPPALHGGLGDSSLPVPSVGSPASAGPSPLTHSQHSRPASAPPADAAMPTLSPHLPPTAAANLEAADKVTPAATPSDLNGPKSVSSVSNQVFSPYPAASSVEAAAKPVDSVGGGSQGPASAHSAAPLPPHPPAPPEHLPSLKRPVLSSKEYESVLLEEEQSSQLLYDYSSLDAWLNYPVKRLKQSESSKSPTGKRRPSASSDLYTPGHAAVSPASMLTVVKQEVTVKQEPGCMMQNDNAHQKNDPYVFDDLAAPAVSMEGFKRNNSIKEEDRRSGATSVLPPFDPIIANGPIPKATSGNLFTNEGLQASYKDLDQIFDNSDDTSSDETVATPPDSNNPPGMHEDSAVTTVVTVKPPRSSGGNTSNTGTLRQEELSKMFPTPPSMEHNPGASPCGHMSDGPSGEPSDLAGTVRVRQDIYPSLGSPQEENIEDWSYVFRPPMICRMVGSSKYAPLTNLSKDMPPVVLPPNCVYKPSWQYPPAAPHVEKSSPAVGQVGSGLPGTNSRPNSVASNQVSMPHPPHPHHPILPHPRAGLSPISPASHFPTSPMALPHHLQQFRGGGPGSVGGARTPCPPPPTYELASPATSNASSYHKNLNSVEPEPAPTTARAPEASSLVVNILLADTALNIFRDHNFDSCNMCVCNAGPKVIGNIQGADAAMYLPVPQPQPTIPVPFPPASPFPGMGMGGPLPPPYGMMGSSPAHHRGPAAEEEINCTCGFSAVVNRRHSHRTGLFYEDEVEITGLAEDPSSRRKGSLASYLLPGAMKGQEGVGEVVDALPQGVMDLLREQCVIAQSPTNSLYRAARCFRAGFGPSGIPYSTTINMLDYSDGNEVTFLALEQGRQALLESTMVAMCKVEEMHQRQQMMQQHGGKGQDRPCVHMWPYLRAKGPRCSQDVVRVMKGLQPLLQDAVQKKCTTRLWEAPYTVSGPLTWRQFHRLAGRGTEDRCEPQPIPSLMVGHDKDWLCLSPYAIHYWEKLLLEPYSYSRDVAYIVVAPDSDYVLQKVRTFFRELSAVYEVCRLGRHSPITKVLREGILRVGKSAAGKLAKEPVDEWFGALGDGPAAATLRLYARVCCHHLAPHLSQIPMDRSLLDPLDGSQGSASQRSLPSPMPPPSTPEGQPPDKAPSTPKSDHDGDGSGSGRDVALCTDSGHEDDSQEPPAVVVYLVDPFTVGSDSTDLQRLACLGLLRCFSTVLAGLPDHVRANVCVQIISLESIIELGMLRDLHRYNDHMRAQAFSVFSQCRRMLTHTSSVKSLTGFGTAAMTDLFLKTKDEKNRAPYRLYTPPYVLAPVKEKTESSESFGQPGAEHCSVLYVSYCLSEDQHWLLAVATDDRGEVFETCVVDVDVPNRGRRRRASARRAGLQKLMDFVLGVMSQSVQPWRLVVGRIGRVGHGELKGWSVLLSRKALLKASKQLKEICSQCSLMYPSGAPCVLSACLVSLEPDTVLRLMSDQFTPDERFSQASLNCQLSTPQDVSCTHILVFPTSATTQSSQSAFQDSTINGPEFGDELFPSLDNDMPEGIEEMPMDLNDIFAWPETGLGGAQSPTGSPRRGDSPSQPGSPACGLGGMSDQHSPFPCNGTSRSGGSLGVDSQDEVGLLHQQPLALGFYVSTAPTGRMPRWFWASCPHLEGVCPAFLKNALLLHVPAIHQNDDLLQQQSAVAGHPLDSQYTTDVLRYVLEGYNALSWLALDSNTRDRLSCLPVHVQALMQLYHMTSALV